MKILSIDTSSKNCSISIIEFNNNLNGFNVIAEKNSNDERTHSQKLMPMIEQIFKENSLSLDEIDLLACCIGPGSFTGIRIGVATVKAFCDTKNISAVAVDSLESLSYNVLDTGYIIPIIDAKNENVYSALFYYDGQNYKKIENGFSDNIKNCLDTLSSTIERINNRSDKRITFAGDGSVSYREIIEEKFYDKNIVFSESNDQSSISLARCAYSKYLNGECGDSSILSPIYLRKSQAERIANGEQI